MNAMISSRKPLIWSLYAFAIVVAVKTQISAAEAQPSPWSQTIGSESYIGTTPYDDVLSKYNTGNLTPKIFNGKLAPDGAFPWQAGLIIARIGDPLKGFFCSGAIYNENWVITAAHCLVRKEPAADPKGKLVPLTKSQLFIIYGTNVIKAGVPQSDVDAVILNQNYKPDTFDNDIALIKLTKPIQFDNKTKKIEIVTPQGETAITKKGAFLTVTGWGSTNAAEEHAGIASRKLRSGAVRFVPEDTCKKSISNSPVTSNMICTYDESVDICTGDSGGPIVPYPAALDTKLLGIVSGNWAGDCRNEDYQRHTRVSKFIEWIEKCTSSPNACAQG